MIEKMKKVSVLVKNNELTTSLSLLRKAGVLHISETGSKRSEEIERDEQLLSLFNRVVTAIEQVSGKKNKPSVNSVNEFIKRGDSIQDIILHCHELDTIIIEKSEKNDYVQELNTLVERLSSWGNFQSEDIKYLQDSGVSLLPAEVPIKSIELLGDEFPYIFINKGKKLAKIVFLNIKEDELPDFVTVLKYNGLSLNDIQQNISRANERVEHINAIISDENKNLLVYKDINSIIDSEHQLKTIQENMGCDGPVSWVIGYIPEKSVAAFRDTAVENSWGLLIETPSDEDNVPTKLKNNWLVRMIQPVFNLLGTVPGYKEYDVSMFFLMFFTVFCAMIIGDAGYGVIFLAGAFALNIKTKKTGELVRLIYVLSVSTIVWGAVTGTWFGSSTIVNMPFFRQFVIPGISSFPELFNMTSQDAAEFVMYICFILGIIQLSLACIINFIRQIPQLKSIAQLGWLSMLIGLYTLTLKLVLNKVFPSWGIYAIIGGLAVIVIFGEQSKSQNFMIGLLKGFAGLFTTFLDSISAFSNIISYIRLFAVGMSSVAIASSFNTIASGFPDGIAIVGAILIVLIGHGLNIAMGLLSVIVHGVRLNMLEFSGQMGMEWSGTAYTPLNEYKSNYFSKFYDRT
jgi:V/A-type H+/Na+-transporting ATPase subunit I